MPLTTRGMLTTLSLALASGPIAAEWRCDCTTIVGSCQAEAAAGESFIEVTSNVEQCARVDYFVDGIPFVALVVDGSERQDWIARSATPSIIVSSCQVCVDNSGSENLAAANAGNEAANQTETTKLIGVEAIYPPAAAAAGIEGHVDVRFSISASGTVLAPEVVASEPRGVFEAAALAAVSRWRYSRPPAGESPQITERLEFRLEDAILAIAPDRTANTGVPAAGNACIREDSRYDFGVSVDISLINACAEPLLVYSCTVGTGTYRDRWTCGHTENSATVLGTVTGDGVVVSTAAGTRTFAAADRLEISRAPNSEYWWLACSVGNNACRDEARQWVRVMDRQLAEVDPQDRTRSRLGRSY